MKSKEKKERKKVEERERRSNGIAEGGIKIQFNNENNKH